MTHAIGWVLRHRLWVLLGCLVVSGAFGVAIARVQIATSLPTLLFGGDPRYDEYLELTETFGSDERLLIALPWDDQASSGLVRAIPRIRAIEDVAYVDAPLPTPVPLLPGANPLRSADGSHALLVVELTPDQHRTIERAPALVGEVLALLEEAGFDPGTLRVGGPLAVTRAIQQTTIHTFMVLIPVSAIALFAATWVLMRSVVVVLVTFAIGTLSVLWTVGFAALVHGSISLPIAVSPAVILTIAFADVVHLMTAHAREVALGTSPREAIVKSAADVAPACLITSLTTFIGFLGISLVDTPALRMLGVALGFGVGAALVLAVLLVPIALSLVPARATEATVRAHARTDRLLAGARGLSATRPRTVVVLFALLTIPCAALMWRVEVETDFVDRFVSSSQIHADNTFLIETFGGTNNIDLIVDLPVDRSAEELWSDGGPGGLAALVDALNDTPGVSRVVLPSPMMVAMLPPGSRARFYDDEHQRLRVVVLLDTWAMREANGVAQDAAAVANGWRDDASAQAVGLNVLAGLWLDENVDAQRRALLATFGLIAIAMTGAFRSVRVGAVSMIPNVFPLIVLGGAVGLLFPLVDSDAAVAPLIAIGIAVDDTIHMLARYRKERARGLSLDDALARTFDTSGRAVVITSIIFAVGFLPLLTSDYSSIRMIGVLVPTAILAALFGDVLLLPAMVRLGWFGRRET